MSLKDYRTVLVLTLGAASVSLTSFSPIFPLISKGIKTCKTGFFMFKQRKKEIGLNSYNHLWVQFKRKIHIWNTAIFNQGTRQDKYLTRTVYLSSCPGSAVLCRQCNIAKCFWSFNRPMHNYMLTTILIKKKFAAYLCF